MNFAAFFTADTVSTVLFVIAGILLYVVHRLQKEDEEWNKKDRH